MCSLSQAVVVAVASVAAEVVVRAPCCLCAPSLLMLILLCSLVQVIVVAVAAVVASVIARRESRTSRVPRCRFK